MLPGEKQPFIVHCGNKKCNHEWAIGFLPMSLDIAGKFKNTKCPLCNSKNVLLGPFPKETEESNFRAWLNNGDTGVSSETIWAVMTGENIERPYWQPDVPHDPSDFGRCYRLVNMVMPQWKNRLQEVAEKYQKWKPFVDNWNELESLYREELSTGKCPKLFKRIMEVINEKNL